MNMKGLKIVSLNVRSLYPHLNELYVRFKDYDIMCFCETWLTSAYKDQMIAMDGFDIFRLDRETGGITNNNGKPKRGGGLIIYIKKELSKHTKFLDASSFVTNNLEQLWISIDKPNVSTKLISNIYRPPSARLTEGLKELSDSIEKTQNLSRGELTIVGDFNVNYTLRHSLPFKILKKFEREFNLTQLINTATHHGNSKSTCIDLIFTNMTHVISSGTLDIAISDHLPVYIIKKKEKKKSTHSFIKARSYAKYDKQNFQEEVRYDPKWVDFWNVEENKPEEMWEKMLEIRKGRSSLPCQRYENQ